MASNSEQNIAKYLVGFVKPKIDGDQLPTKRQVLQVLFYHTHFINPRKSLRLSTTAVVDQVKVFWTRARLPIQIESRCIERLETLYYEWSNLQKNKSKTSNVEKEKMFSENLNLLFDISHGNILENHVVDKRRRDFLRDQQSINRSALISDIENYFEQREAREIEKHKLMELRLKKSEMEIDLMSTISL